MLGAFGFLARYGRFVLVGGLVAGLVLPGVAFALRPWLSELVLLLLFLTAFRVGPANGLKGLTNIRSTFGIVLTYQLALPLVCIALFSVFGYAGSPFAIALTLMLAAPSVTANPNMAVLLGHAPEPAFRLLILGTVILPLTLIPIFWFSPALGDLLDAVLSAFHLGMKLSATIALAFALRAFMRPTMREADVQALDGLTSLALAVIVIGLMSAVAPAITAKPWVLAKWLVLALVANLGLQALAYLVLRRFGDEQSAAPMALVAGNRNVALFLLASSATQTDAFLIFLGCYQFPMYLTPILMRPLFRQSKRTIRPPKAG